MNECRCGHVKDDHEYAFFHGIEDYGQCAHCSCTVFEGRQSD